MVCGDIPKEQGSRGTRTSKADGRYIISHSVTGHTFVHSNLRVVSSCVLWMQLFQLQISNLVSDGSIGSPLREEQTRSQSAFFPPLFLHSAWLALSPACSRQIIYLC